MEKRSNLKLEAVIGTIMVIVFIMLLCFQKIQVLGSEETKEEITTIRIGYVGYEGFLTQEEDGSYVGYGVEFLEEIAIYTGWNYEFVYGTIEGHMEKLKTGEIDFLMQIQKTPEREAKFVFSEYIVGTEENLIYVREDEDRYYYSDYEHYNGIKIACVAESYQESWLEGFAEKKGFVYEPYVKSSPSECFEALENGLVDAVAIGSNYFDKNYKIVSRFGSSCFYAMTGQGNTELMNQLDDVMEMIYALKPDFQQDLKEKYYGNTSEHGGVFTREETAYIKENNDDILNEIAEVSDETDENNEQNVYNEESSDDITTDMGEIEEDTSADTEKNRLGVVAMGVIIIGLGVVFIYGRNKRHKD